MRGKEESRYLGRRKGQRETEKAITEMAGGWGNFLFFC